MSFAKKRLKRHRFVVATDYSMPFNKDMSSPTAINMNEADKENPPLTNEDYILKIAKSKDKEAFIHLFNYFAPRLKSYLMKSGLSAENAEEIAQEAMLVVWHKAVTFNPEKAAASTWIFTIARNKKVDALRKINRAQYDPLDPLLDIKNDQKEHIEEITQKQNAALLQDVIKTLPDEQSEIIRKAFYEDKTHQVIADEMKLPLGTVKSRIRLGMERLRHALSGQEMKEIMD